MLEPSTDLCCYMYYLTNDLFQGLKIDSLQNIFSFICRNQIAQLTNQRLRRKNK